MVKKILFVTVVIMMLSANKLQAGVSIIMNGSFENDGHTINNIADEAPQRWRDVNLPSAWFGGSVYQTDWPTHGDYYLSLYSYALGDFDVNQTATVSQDVYLTDANEIIFNLKLDTTYNDPWDPARRSAVLMIGPDVVWESNSVGSDVRGEYITQTYNVSEIYKDGRPHKLSVGIRAKQTETSYIHYYAHWDFVRFDTHCDCYGFDYPQGDINRDCQVDWQDLNMLTEQWLQEPPNYKYDLFEDLDDIINLRDFAVLADSWMGSDLVEDNALLISDLNNDGIVDFYDFAILAEDADFEDIGILADEWLLKSWLYGL